MEIRESLNSCVRGCVACARLVDSIGVDTTGDGKVDTILVRKPAGVCARREPQTREPAGRMCVERAWW